MTEKVSANVYWIWFQLVFGYGSLRAETMMRTFETAKEIYDGVKANSMVASALTQNELTYCDKAFNEAIEIERRSVKKGITIITPDSEEYPELLMHIYSKPAVLYVKGDMTCLTNRLAIGMVGSRKHTEYGKDTANFLATGLAQADVVVVSGLAHGIDTECHMAAVKAGGKSIGVLGCGLDIDYPKGNADVKRALVDTGGAVISEYPLGFQQSPWSFPIRNRIIAGLSHGVVVVEAEVHSGSIITARHANENGREVFAVPGSILSTHSLGAHSLIKDGAYLCSNASDIVEVYAHLGLNINANPMNNSPQAGVTSFSKRKPMSNDDDSIKVTAHENKAKAKPKPPAPDGISDDANAVYALFASELIGIDEIAAKTGVNVGGILSALTELEIYGLIQGYPGRKFGLL